MNLYTIAVIIMAWPVIWGVVITKRYYQELKAYWKEPALKHPVLIFESDDWGAGPLIQSQSLTCIEKVLSQYTDRAGHHPVMTLGVVLSIPDVDKIKKIGFKHYYAKFLDHPDFFSVKIAMINGLEQGVFDLQLHGMAHFWPDNLMRELQASEEIRHWLTHERFSRTETLPSVLQSRWVNTAQLPTTPLNQNEIDTAVKEEVNAFKKLFGFNPKVVVPPTFVWNEMVERSWKQCSLSYLVTPGQCFEQRDDQGKPNGNGNKIVNGQLSSIGLTYIVRNDYFEPSLGHTAEMAIKSLDTKTKLAQPTLLEIHRSNFIENNEVTENSLKELEKTLIWTLEKYPDVLFLSTKELADKYLSNEVNFIEKSYLTHVLVCIERLWGNHTIRKWLYLSGLFLPLLFLINYRKYL